MTKKKAAKGDKPPSKGKKVDLPSGDEIWVKVKPGTKKVKAFKAGKPINVKKRTLTVIVLDEKTGKLNAEATVSCSHLDNYSKKGGRREAFKKLIKTEPLNTLSRKDKTALAEVLHIT